MATDQVRATIPAMRVMLYTASMLVLLAGISLYVFSDTTAETFAWTIAPPLTAAFLGAGYWSACVLEFLSARRRTWAHARVAVPAVWLFTTLTLVASLLHLDRFHFRAPLVLTVVGTWIWMAVYILVPVTLGVIWLLQLRAPGGDPPLVAPLSRWVRAVLAIECVIALGIGIALFVMPQAMAPEWPWKLTPLTARATGAWSLGLACLVASTLYENDWMRARPATWYMLLYPVFQAVALLRYPHTPQWSSAAAAGYVLFLVVLFTTGVYGLYMSRSTSRRAMA